MNRIINRSYTSSTQVCPNLDTVAREPRNSLDNVSVVASRGGHRDQSFPTSTETMRTPSEASSEDEYRANRRRRNKRTGNNVRRQRRDSQRSNTTASESTATTNLTNMSSAKIMEDNKYVIAFFCFHPLSLLSRSDAVSNS
ncbi:hypothetical protein PoB_005842000 [Plakobranchus ocellatus]|uniref:BZIP domain-containing protein n=1 Tax=Plakobranchus ocellatus TaxID=259542 RepID=A0AAV4CGF3_9GAST|nr:hypothetical protein PoB_005842000 [Plakobranchus ocellatus]